MRSNRVRVVFERDSSLDEIIVTVKAPERNETVEALLEQLGEVSPQQITITEENGIPVVISPDDILLVSVDDKRLDIITETEKYSFRGSLQSFEKCLDENKFIRISRYEIANLTKVKHYDFTIKGTLRLEFINGMEAWASRRCISAIRRRISGKE